MKVAVIGVGNWGRNLVRTLDTLGALAAAAEADAARRAMLAADFPGLAVYPDYLPVLATDIPAVAIATPAATHFPVARASLLAGKDVFLEKPMTLTSAEAEHLVHLAGEQRRILMVGHLLLYQPSVVWIKEYLAAGSLGEVKSLHQERLNLGRARSVENALWSLGVHDVAVLLHLIGESPTGLQVTGQCAHQPGVEDDVYLHLSFNGGTQAHLHSSWLWPERRRRLVAIGSLGMLAYDESDQTVTLHRKGINPDLSNRDEGVETVYQGKGAPLTLEIEHFLACIRERRPPISDGESGAAVIGVLEEATRLLKGVQA